jgi:pyruvate, orthophosphate dikinase
MAAASLPDDLLLLGGSRREPPAALVGGKGASLFWMASRDRPVPPFFVLTSGAWQRWNRVRRLDDELLRLIREGIADLEGRTGLAFGKGPDPLLVSVRSSGAVSMPGMMDTVLNLGLAPESIAALLTRLGDLAALPPILETFVNTFWQAGFAAEAVAVPLSAEVQLTQAIEKVFASWNNERARLYRRMRRIPEHTGTAVVVQAMVFGNWDARSGTGVLFTRDPITGAPEPKGEWAARVQGEAVVSGRTTPESLDRLALDHPEVHSQLRRQSVLIEREAGEAQDVEYTVQSGRLYLLQTRRLKVTPLAACRIAIDLWQEGAIDRETLGARLREIDLDELGVDSVEEAGVPPLATGLPASPGVACGLAVASSSEAARIAASGQQVVLVRPQTSPNDLPGMRSSVAVITERGGMTSHAAIVARELHIPCVVGCGALSAALDAGTVTVDGGAGRVFAGQRPARREVPAFVRLAREVIEAHPEAVTRQDEH